MAGSPWAASIWRSANSQQSSSDCGPSSAARVAAARASGGGGCPVFHGTVEKNGGQVVVRGLQAVVALDGPSQIAFRFVKLAEADQTIGKIVEHCR